MEEIKGEEVNPSVGGEETKSAEGQADTTKKKWFKCNCDCGKKKHIIAGVVLILILVGIAGYYYKTKKTDIGPDAAKAKIEKLIGESNAGVEVKGVSEESELYKITIGIDKQPDQYAYVTKDGTKFIQQAISFEDIEKQQAEQKKAEEEANRPVEKSDKPNVDLFVMSFCPYGNKAEDTLKPVYDLLKNKVNFNFYYIVSSNGDAIQSLHGQKEVDQNEREACVLKNYGKDKWFGFVTYVNKNCGSDGACWKSGAKAWSIDVNKINACVAAEGTALMKENENVSNEAKAQGSPTMIINGASIRAVQQYGNPEAYKQAICGAFNTAPAECAKKLSVQTTTVAPGGSCGN